MEPQWQPVLRSALIAGECHSGRFIFSPRRGLNPLCRPPLTPHLLSSLMWLYWLWHTEHGDDDQTIKSPPPPKKKEGPLESQTIPTGFVLPERVCVRVPKMWQYISSGGRSEIPLTHTTASPLPANEPMNMKQSSRASLRQRRRRAHRKTRLSLWLNYQQSGRDQGDHMIAWRYCWLITVTQPLNSLKKEKKKEKQPFQSALS